MKKMFLVLAVLLTVVGVAFATDYTYTEITRYRCGQHQKSARTVKTSDSRKNGKSVYVTDYSADCPSCEALKKSEQNTQDVCNVLRGTSSEIYNDLKTEGKCK